MPVEPQLDVSVVVPAYRGAATIAACLTSILRALGTRPAEVIVVDSSSDETADIVRERFPAVRLLQVPVRLTAGEARNRGVACARGRFVMFTDQDCTVAPDWVERLLAHLETPGVDGVGGTVSIRNPENYAGCALYFLEFLHHFPFPGPPRPDTNFLVGCNAAYRRDVLEAMPFPDQTLAEDVLFAHRLRALGYRTLYDPSIEVQHQNKEGWRLFLTYNYEMGRASAAYHASLQLPRARLFLRFPALAYGLPLMILPTVAARLLRSRRAGYVARFALLSPLCLAGNLFWAAGFRRQALSGDAARFNAESAEPVVAEHDRGASQPRGASPPLAADKVSAPESGLRG